MKKANKILAIILALLTLLSLAACGGEKEPEEPAVIGGDMSAGEVLLVDKDGMKITLTGIEDKNEHWYFNLRGENNSKNTLTIAEDGIILNGYFYNDDNTEQNAIKEIAPGETKEGYVAVRRSPESKGIYDKVIEVKFLLGIYENYSFVEYYPVATVYGPDKGAEMPSVQDGKLVYDKNNVKVWADQEIYPQKDGKSVMILFNIENNSDKEIRVIPDEGFEINGFAAKNIVELSKIGAGLKLRDWVCPLSYDEKADFSKVNSLKMSFEVGAVDGSWTDKVDTFDLMK